MKEAFRLTGNNYDDSYVGSGGTGSGRPDPECKPECPNYPCCLEPDILCDDVPCITDPTRAVSLVVQIGRNVWVVAAEDRGSLPKTTADARFLVMYESRAGVLR